jgi:AcrR family transcriptional regulator
MQNPPESERESPQEGERRSGARAARVGGRSERVVRDVRSAAAAEMARVGYVALRVEDVAARAGVNKTTVYRRWPTKADLVKDMLRGLGGDLCEAPDTGSLERDLLELLRRFIARVTTPEGQGIYRMLMAELHQPEVEAFARSLREEHAAPWHTALGRAVSRGDLPQGSDTKLMIEMIRGAVANRIYRLHEPVDEGFLEGVVTLVVGGARQARRANGESAKAGGKGGAEPSGGARATCNEAAPGVTTSSCRNPKSSLSSGPPASLAVRCSVPSSSEGSRRAAS